MTPAPIKAAAAYLYKQQKDKKIYYLPEPRVCIPAAPAATTATTTPKAAAAAALSTKDDLVSDSTAKNQERESAQNGKRISCSSVSSRRGAVAVSVAADEPDGNAVRGPPPDCHTLLALDGCGSGALLFLS